MFLLAVTLVGYFIINSVLKDYNVDEDDDDDDNFDGGILIPASIPT